MLSVFEANQVKAELSRQGVNLRTFAHNLSDHDSKPLHKTASPPLKIKHSP